MQNMSKTSRDNLLTCVMIAVVCIIVQIVSGSGVMSNQMKGLLVPLCVYSIMAVSLNLVVGILGELSLGHAGFMCVGAFSSALSHRHSHRGGRGRHLRIPDRYPGSAP